MEHSKGDLMEARRQIDSTLHKLREVVKTLEARDDPRRCQSQITLARRRIAAFQLANDLIAAELEKSETLP